MTVLSIAVACASLGTLVTVDLTTAAGAMSIAQNRASDMPREADAEPTRTDIILIQQKTGNELAKCNRDCETEYQDCQSHGIKRGKEMRSWDGHNFSQAEKCTMQKAFCIEWECIKGAHPPSSFYK